MCGSGPVYCSRLKVIRIYSMWSMTTPRLLHHCCFSIFSWQDISFIQQIKCKNEKSWCLQGFWSLSAMCSATVLRNYSYKGQKTVRVVYVTSPATSFMLQKTCSLLVKGGKCRAVLGKKAKGVSQHWYWCLPWWMSEEAHSCVVAQADTRCVSGPKAYKKAWKDDPLYTQHVWTFTSNTNHTPHQTKDQHLLLNTSLFLHPL